MNNNVGETDIHRDIGRPTEREERESNGSQTEKKEELNKVSL
jgi:hypothetical protein